MQFECYIKVLTIQQLTQSISINRDGEEFRLNPIYNNLIGQNFNQ